MATPVFAQLPLLDSLSRDPTDDAAYGRMPFDSLTDLPTTCAVGYCIRGLVDTLGVITFDCMPCSGAGAPTPTPPAATLTATPTPTINVCGEIPNCITPTPTPTVTVTPTATSTPPPSATATPAWCSIVGTCETSTPAPTATPSPCETVAGWDIGGLYGLPGQCKSLLTYTPTPTATPTATATIPPPSPTPTVGLRMVLAGPTVGESTPGPARWRFLWWDDIQNPYGGVATPTPDGAPFATPSTLCATVGPFMGGLTGINPPVCLPTNVATPTPWATPATLCATVGPFLGGLAGINPPVCLPTNVATPTPVPSPTGDFVRKDSVASDPQSMANALEITFPAAGSTPGFVMVPSSEPGVGEEMFAIYPRSSRDPIMQVQSQTDTGAVRTHHLGFRLDRGTDTGSFASTNPQKPVQFILGTAASPLHVSDGISGIELTSVVAFDDVDLELGNFQSYIVVDSSNTNPFYAVGVSSNVTLQGTGGDGTPWTVSEVPASAFKSYLSLAETGSIDRHAAGFVAQAGLNTASGTAANAYYYGFYGPFFDVIGCTSPGTCIDMEEAGALYVPDFSDVGAFPNRFSVKSIGATVRMEHAGSIHVGPTPTPTATATATSVTPTATAVTPTPTATATPLVDVDGHLAIAGNLMLKNTGSDRLLQPMGRVNQAGLTFTIQGIDAVMMANNGTTSLIGGALTLKGGVGTFLARGGDVTVQGGDGFAGANVNVTAPVSFSGALTAAGRILMTGHMSTKQTGSPSVSSCGTSPSVTGNDHNGTITVGTSATSCTLTFGRGWANTPQCFANDRTAVLAVRAVPTTTTVVFDTATASNIASDTIDYWCVGRE